MAIDPTQFDVPVADYDFASANTPRGLIDQMASAGGFTANKLAMARDILRDMHHDLTGVDHDPARMLN